MQKNNDRASKTNYEGLFTELRTSLVRFASKYFKRTEDAEDIVQEAFLKVMEADKKTDISSPKSYLYRTTKNLALNEISKKANKLTDTVGDYLPESISIVGPSLEDELESKKKLEFFCQALDHLPEKCRTAFVLRRVYGYPHKRIAEEMGISTRTVEIHITRAIVRCTDFMDEMESETTDHPNETRTVSSKGGRTRG
ncbi:RNA polymerase sigma factor [Teredinibacter haidensis]|uniref:RNA polymerase sigma factor n=1 Tax=Teredinibacter haidensis TaxID=2731755 RepID=UPI000948D32D|nr:RNA polymerase sigma factor [Teredinibacter haidensis]